MNGSDNLSPKEPIGKFDVVLTDEGVLDVSKSCDIKREKFNFVSG